MKKGKTNYIVIFLLLAIISTSLIACSNSKDQSNKETSEEPAILTTEDLQEYFNDLVDNSLSFMENFEEIMTWSPCMMPQIKKKRFVIQS